MRNERTWRQRLIGCLSFSVLGHVSTIFAFAVVFPIAMKSGDPDVGGAGSFTAEMIDSKAVEIVTISPAPKNAAQLEAVATVEPLPEPPVAAALEASNSLDENAVIVQKAVSKPQPKKKPVIKPAKITPEKLPEKLPAKALPPKLVDNESQIETERQPRPVAPVDVTPIEPEEISAEQAETELEEPVAPLAETIAEAEAAAKAEAETEAALKAEPETEAAVASKPESTPEETFDVEPMPEKPLAQEPSTAAETTVAGTNTTETSEPAPADKPSASAMTQPGDPGRGNGGPNLNAPVGFVTGANGVKEGVKDARNFELPGNKPPNYPTSARFKGERGNVSFIALIDDSGKVRNFQMVQSSGSKALDAEAQSAMQRWLFRPGATGYVKKTFSFNLKGKEQEFWSRQRRQSAN